METNKAQNTVIHLLEERAKELNCLYTVEDLLNSSDTPMEVIASGIIAAIIKGWQYPLHCRARITIGEREYMSDNFQLTKWKLSADIKVQDEIAGKLEVFYAIELPIVDEGPFLKDEKKLLSTIADRLGHYLLHSRLRDVFNNWQNQKQDLEEKPKPEWYVVLDLLRRTDQPLSSIISRKMVNLLFYKGIEESTALFKKLGNLDDSDSLSSEVNTPSKKQLLDDSFNTSIMIFEIASKYLSEEEILSSLMKWINEEKTRTLVNVLSNRNSPMIDIADSIRRYYHANPDIEEVSSPTMKGLRVSLIRRFLTEQLEFINIAKNFTFLRDYYYLLNNIIFPQDSYGKLGGKSAGLLIAKKIIELSAAENPVLADIKIPKTWYITSDGLMVYVYYNSLEDIVEHKYKEIDEIRREYPYIIQAFKNSNFPPDIINGLSRALDDFGENPIIVRSSSLLEDRIGSAFAGKYKSLFLANQGTKEQRLEALTDAIAEVYASTVGPDPIGYRLERGLIDFNEEMGIMIQEVVGNKVGKYFFPAFAGVAFSKNEFRWSPRIKRDDGLLRMVPGLGTRAVDRIGDDYPIMLAPGNPSLRVNLTFDEMVGYSPKNLDVINLENNTFETISVEQILKETGSEFPFINLIFSIVQDKHLQKPIGLGVNPEKHSLAVTFENLFTGTPFLTAIHKMLKLLEEKLNTPVDIEFASNGKELYLLQCRPQSASSDIKSSPIPRDIAEDKIIFTGTKHISNGKVPEIEHIVYVDPVKYSQIENLDELKTIGAIVGKLNKLLPRRKFILMGPGRWGSRGDIRLGVNVTYSDINNTSMLIEIAKAKGNYVPDLSFGTHFFQDLVEASIRYLPLYPDDRKTVFKEDFLMETRNSLNEILPEYESFSDCVKVINVKEVTNGCILKVLLNADEEMAIAYLSKSH